MKLLGTIIIFAFAAVSILGFSSMAHGSEGHHEDCLFAQIAESACVFVHSGLASISHHLSALQSSIQGIVSSSGAVLMAFLFVFLIISVANIFKEKLRFQFAYYIRSSEAERPTSNFFIELFSRGILNPKVYLV